MARPSSNDWPDLPNPYRDRSPEERATLPLTPVLVIENAQLLRAWSACMRETDYSYSRVRPDRCTEDCSCQCHAQASRRGRSR